MVEVSTSILSVKEEEAIKTFYNLETAKTDYFHIDVMDGKFVEKNTYQKMIENGQLMKQNFKLGLIVLLLFLGIITFLGMYAIQGQNLFLPFTYLKNSLIIWCMDIIL